MAYEATITKSDGTQIKYDLKSRSNLGDVDHAKIVVLFFDNGKVFKGYIDGSVDGDYDFGLKACLNDKFTAALPFDRLLGWAYESDGRQKQSKWRRLRNICERYRVCLVL